MTAITFDTLKYVKTLKAAGFEEQQAEAMAEVQKELLASNLDDLVTKQHLDIKLAEFEVRLIKWMLALLSGQGVLVVIILKLFYGH